MLCGRAVYSPSVCLLLSSVGFGKIRKISELFLTFWNFLSLPPYAFFFHLSLPPLSLFFFQTIRTGGQVDELTRYNSWRPCIYRHSFLAAGILLLTRLNQRGKKRGFLFTLRFVCYSAIEKYSERTKSRRAHRRPLCHVAKWSRVTLFLKCC